MLELSDVSPHEVRFPDECKLDDGELVDGHWGCRRPDCDNFVQDSLLELDVSWLETSMQRELLALPLLDRFEQNAFLQDPTPKRVAIDGKLRKTSKRSIGERCLAIVLELLVARSEPPYALDFELDRELAGPAPCRVLLVAIIFWLRVIIVVGIRFEVRIEVRVLLTGFEV